MLTEVEVKSAKPREKVYRLADGKGLCLEVNPNGSKLWRWRYRWQGKASMLALGAYPETTIKAAREKLSASRKVLEGGQNPAQHRQAEKLAGRAKAENSFEAVAREWHKAQADSWSADHAARTLTRMEKNVFPYIGNLPIDEVTAPQLLAVLKRIEARGAIETATTTRQQCGQVFRFGIASGRCTYNPAPDLQGALKPVIVTHMAAVTDPKEVGALLRAIYDYQGHPITRSALMLSALVFQRPGNVRAAEWSEIDFDDAMWAVPSAKIKRSVQGKRSGRPHLIPLAPQALAVLRELQPLTGGGRFVFPSMLTGARCMSENTVNTALRRMGYGKDEMTAHGFRAMARTIMVEKLGVNPEVIEAQLAHGKSGPLGAAYDRSEYIEQRRKMMAMWADYLDQLRGGGKVVPFKAA